MKVEVIEAIPTRRGTLQPGEIIDVPDAVVHRLAGRVRRIDDHPRAWLQGGKLRTSGLVDDLAGKIVRLTRNDLDLQKRLLLEHCQAFDENHRWRLVEQWQERSAIIEHDGGLPRHEAETEAARLYRLTAWLPELTKGN